MSEKYEIEKRQEITVPQETQPSDDSEPFLKWRYKFNQKTQKSEFDGIELSDGSQCDEKKLKTALKNASGSFDIDVGEKIIKNAAYGMASDSPETRLNGISTLLPALRPKDETEAMLLGQFLTLQDSGMKCLRHANLPDQGFYHEERLLILANKLLNTANQTMQTVIKYRSGGQQTIQVVHVHNEGQAIVTQNLSHSSSGKGPKKNFEN